MQPADIEYIRRFYEEHRRPLFAYALNLAGAPATAEDIIQTVFYRLLRLNQPPRSLKAYVYGAIRNGALDHLRHTSRPAPEIHLVAHLNGATPPEQIALQDEVAFLLQAVSPEERECILLKIFGGLTFEEIAEAQSVSINTAASWYRRGLQKMRAVAKAENP